MKPHFFSIICIAVCAAALYFAYRIYKDTQRLKKKIEKEDDDDRPRF